MTERSTKAKRLVGVSETISMGNATSTISPLKAAFHPEWEEDLTEGERRDWEERKIKVKISGPEENGTRSPVPSSPVLPLDWRGRQRGSEAREAVEPYTALRSDLRDLDPYGQLFANGGAS